MRGIILTNHGQDLYSNRRFLEETKSLKLKIELCPTADLDKLLSRQSKKTDWILVRTTGVDYNDNDLMVCQAWQERSKLTVVNSPTDCLMLREKPAQYLWASQMKLNPIPGLILNAQHSPQSIIQKLDTTLGQDLKQWVLKTNRGNQARGVYFHANKSSLKLQLKQLYRIGDFRYMLQPWLSFNAEYRAFFINGKIIVYARKKYTDPNKPVMSGEGAQFDITETIPDSVSTLLKRTIGATSLIYGAADIACDDQARAYFMELNCVPGFEKMEQLSGLNIAGKILKYLKSRI